MGATAAVFRLFGKPHCVFKNILIQVFVAISHIVTVHSDSILPVFVYKEVNEGRIGSEAHCETHLC